MTSQSCSPSLLLDDVLIGRLRADLVEANWTMETCDGLLSPMAAAALRRDQMMPAAMELEANATAAAVLTRLFVLAESVARESVELALPALSVDGAIALGLVDEDSRRAGAVHAMVGLRPHRGPTVEPDEVAAAAAHSDSPSGPDIQSGPGTQSGPVLLQQDRGENSVERENLAGPGRESDLWVASDLSQAQTGEPPRDDYVLGIASASTNLERLTLRDPVGAALDLGCGCGVLALGLARHAHRVVATDISERACNFTRFNALLNETAIEVRQGSFFDPVRGEHFNLITSNPPFVITPQAVRGSGVLEYRDGGMERDQLIPWIIREAMGHLAPGGTLQMLANWEVAGAEADWAVRPRAWIEQAARPLVESGQSVDVWLVQRDLLDVAQYAEWWIRDGRGPRILPAEWDAEYRQWLEDFAAAGTQFVGLGSLAMRVGVPASGGAKTPGSGTVNSGTADSSVVRLNLSCEYLPEGRPADSLAVRTALNNLSLRPDWDTVPLVCAPDVREVRYFVPGSGNPELIHITQGRAGGRERSVTSAVAALIGVSDGELEPARVIPAIAELLEQDEAGVRAEIESALPELLRSGVLSYL